MITKEEFLDNTREKEVFSVIHEFKERFNEMVLCSTEKDKENKVLNVTDKEIGIISEQMITNIKSQMWIP